MSINLTLLGQAFSLGIFVWFCMKYIWPPIVKVLETRAKSIADGLASAEQSEKKLLQAEQRFQDAVEEGKQKAAEIIGKAEKHGSELIEDAKKSAKQEGQRQLEAAQGEIEQEREKARQALKQQISALVVAGAEQIIMREIDRNAHNDLLDKISSRL